MRRGIVCINVPNCGETAVSFLECGSGDSVVLFLHGFGCEGLLWRVVMESLKPGFRGIALDLPGFGLSPALPVSEAIEELTETIHSFINALRIQKVYLVGHSLGGTLALSFAIKYPRVNKIVTIGPIICGTDFPFIDKTEMECWKLKRELSPILFELFAKPIFAIRVAQRIFYWRDALRVQPETLVASIDAFLRFNASVGVDILSSIMQVDLREGLKEITAPVLWVDGEKIYYKPAMSARYAQLVPSAELWLVPQAGHMLPVVYTKEFADIICKFFERTQNKK